MQTEYLLVLGVFAFSFDFFYFVFKALTTKSHKALSQSARRKAFGVWPLEFGIFHLTFST